MNKSSEKPSFEGEVLLCEDNRMSQELISERLAKVGLETVIAENGKEGIEMVEGRQKKGLPPFALIFMDIHMPGMDGITAAAEIRKLNTGTPIIAITANITPADQEHYSASGMDYCLGKPFTSNQLIDCLMKYLKPASPRPAGEARPSLDDEALKIKLIHNFVRNNETKYLEIARAIDKGDIAQAHRLAHTLKGNAAILGKNRLKKAAEDVERMLASAEPQINRFTLSLLETELDVVFDEYAPLLAEAPPVETTPVNLDKIKPRELFEELETLLDGGCTECLNLIHSLRLIPGSEELIQQMEHFEFERALTTLEQLKEKFSK